MHTRLSISTETMELPLASVFDCEVRCVIWFLHARGESAVEIRTLLIRLVWHPSVHQFAWTFRWQEIRRNRGNQSSGYGVLLKFGSWVLSCWFTKVTLTIYEMFRFARGLHRKIENFVTNLPVSFLIFWTNSRREKKMCELTFWEPSYPAKTVFRGFLRKDCFFPKDCCIKKIFIL